MKNSALNIMKFSQIHSRLTANVFITFLLACVCGLTGCLSWLALNKQTFCLQPACDCRRECCRRNHVLGIRNLQVAAAI